MPVMHVGYAMCGWQFVATEIDALSCDAAFHNVSRNKLGDAIQIVRICPPSSPVQEGAGGVTTCVTGTILLDVIATYSSRASAREAQAGSGHPTGASSSPFCKTTEEESFTNDTAHAGLHDNLSVHSLLKPQELPIFAFTMCNPPFFTSWEEATASMDGYDESACTGAPHEMV
jgi:hypothetical protein